MRKLPCKFFFSAPPAEWRLSGHGCSLLRDANTGHYDNTAIASVDRHDGHGAAVTRKTGAQSQKNPPPYGVLRKCPTNITIQPAAPRLTFLPLAHREH